MTAPILATAGGATVGFSWVQGEVIGTDQRSDSYTSGQGRVVVIEGSGGGGSSVSTQVVVQRDIWLRTPDGQEEHVRLQRDVPVRVGQEIALISCNGEVHRPDLPSYKAGGLVAAFVLSTNRSYPVLPLGAVAATLAVPPSGRASRAGEAVRWLLSLLLVPIFGIGIGLLLALLVRSLIRSRRRQALTLEILGEMETGFQTVLDELHSKYLSRLGSAGHPVPSIQSGDAVSR